MVPNPEAAALHAQRRPWLRGSRLEAVKGYLFVSPFLAFFCLIFAYPIGRNVFLSLTRYSILDNEITFIGAGNYGNLFRDTLFIQALKNVGVYLIVNIPLMLAISLGLAALVNNRHIRFKSAFRSSYFLPVITSAVVASLVWQWIYSPQVGIANYLLSLVGVPAQRFLTGLAQAMPCIAVMNVWKVFGYYFVIFFAGLQTVPVTLLEASRVDGAGPFRQFWHITLPLLNPTVLLVVVLSTIAGLQVFTEPYIMTRGGPANMTLTPALYLYNKAFMQFHMGYAAAIGVVLGVTILVASLIEFKLIERRVHY